MERRLLGRNEGRTDDNIETIRKRFNVGATWQSREGACEQQAACWLPGSGCFLACTGKVAFGASSWVFLLARLHPFDFVTSHTRVSFPHTLGTWQVFIESTVPVVAHYEQQGKVARINADRGADDIYKEVRRLFLEM